MTYTTTEERTFTAQETDKENPAAAVNLVWLSVKEQARNSLFSHIVPEVSEIIVFVNGGGYFQAEASITYARIVPAEKEKENEKEDRDPRAYDPEVDDEYYGADEAKAKRLGVSIQDVRDGEV